MGENNETADHAVSAEEGTAFPVMRKDDEFFCDLIDHIPPRYYFDQDTAKEIREQIQQDTDNVMGKVNVKYLNIRRKYFQ